jgi:hypothetical protein
MLPKPDYVFDTDYAPPIFCKRKAKTEFTTKGAMEKEEAYPMTNF